MKRQSGIVALAGVALLGFLTVGAWAQDKPSSDWVIETHHKCKVLDRQPLGAKPTNPNYELWWSGTCKDGYASGSGSLQWGFPNKNPTFPPLVVADYDGPLVEGKMTGNGSISLSSGDKYTGDLVNNEATGFGKTSYEDGTSYEGHFSRNRKSGHGTQRWPNGDTVEGEWANDDFANGFVIWDSPSGHKHFEGYFVGGRASGHGYLIEDGVRHEGEWKDGKLTSNGIEYTVQRQDLFPK